MVKKEETRVVWVLTTVVLWMLVYELGLVVSSIAIRSKLVMGEKGVGGRIAQRLVLGGRLSRARGSANSALQLWNRNVTVDGERAMTMGQFRAWMKTIDGDKDGKISKDELSDAVRGNGGWFAGWKARRGVGSADSNGNGFVDESEIGNLVEFAQKHLGIKII
ncbi:hypothetical protein D5086_025498 [Populus alba]|uniref:Uncharacterized protein n=1 Tax=Populus alba TaxID=43335 RepID=A0ACC4AZT6_POPAL